MCSVLQCVFFRVPFSVHLFFLLLPPPPRTRAPILRSLLKVSGQSLLTSLRSIARRTLFLGPRKWVARATAMFANAPGVTVALGRGLDDAMLPSLNPNKLRILNEKMVSFCEVSYDTYAAMSLAYNAARERGYGAYANAGGNVPLNHPLLLPPLRVGGAGAATGREKQASMSSGGGSFRGSVSGNTAAQQYTVAPGRRSTGGRKSAPSASSMPSFSETFG